jgi:predicted secreted protein
VLRVGADQTIRLPSRSGAGYDWSVEVADGDPDAVAVKQVDPEAPSGPPGESPDHVFRLSPLRPGEVVLRFEQRRPWDEAAAPREVRTFDVVVEDR